jgi:hypothetical protein
MNVLVKLHRQWRPILLKQLVIVIVGALLCIAAFCIVTLLHDSVHQRPSLNRRYALLLRVQQTYGNGPYDTLLDTLSYRFEDLVEIAEGYGVTVTKPAGNGTLKELVLRAKTDLDVLQFWQEVHDCYGKGMAVQYFSLAREARGVQGKVIVHAVD